jgi:hypothetical protein
MLLYLLFGRLTGRIPPSKIKGAGKHGPTWWLLSISLFVYYAVMGIIGFLPTTFLYVMGFQMWVSGSTKSWLKAGAYGLATAFLFWAAMTYVMQVPIPAGMLPFFK